MKSKLKFIILLPFVSVIYYLYKIAHRLKWIDKKPLDFSLTFFTGVILSCELILFKIVRILLGISIDEIQVNHIIALIVISTIINGMFYSLFIGGDKETILLLNRIDDLSCFQKWIIFSFGMISSLLVFVLLPWSFH